MPGKNITSKTDLVGLLDAELPISSREGDNDAARHIIASLDGIDPSRFKNAAELRKALRGDKELLKSITITSVNKGKTTKKRASLSSLPAEQRYVLQKYIDNVGVLFAKAHRENEDALSQSEALSVINGVYGITPPASVPKLFKSKAAGGEGKQPIGNRVDEAFRNSDAARRMKIERAKEARETELRLDEQRRILAAGGNPASATVAPQEAPVAPEKAKSTVQKRRDTLLKWGMSRTVADKLLKQGFDPMNPPASLDADAFGVTSKTIRRLEANGIKVKGGPGVTSGKGGLSKQELLKGRRDGSNTIRGAGRLQKQRGLFRRKVLYEDDGKGGVTRVELDPRITFKGAGKAIHKNTIGGVSKALDKRTTAREKKRLDKPFHRISRIQELAQRDDIASLQGKIESATGLARSWARLRLAVLQGVLLHKAIAAFVLVAALFFVPWFGVLTWTGYGLANLAQTFFQFGALVLVNIYNLVAGAMVGAINLVGNAVIGAFEAASNGVLNFLKLDPTSCGGEACKRTFSYTVSEVDTDFAGFPKVPAPSKFDDRTLIDLVLGLFGIKWGFVNEIRTWFRGG